MAELTPQSEPRAIDVCEHCGLTYGEHRDENPGRRALGTCHNLKEMFELCREGVGAREAERELARWRDLDSDMLRSFVTAVRAHCLFPNAPEADSLEALLKRTELLHTRLEKLRA